jgi:hypothetical protein
LLGSFNIRSTNDVSVNNFAVDDGILYAHINSVVTTNANVEVPGIGTLQAALPTEFASILSYSLTANRVISSAAVSSSVSGFAYNGAILLSDLSAEVEFFPVSRATITDAIAPVDPLGEFAVIDAVFLDHDRYYVVSAGRLYSMPLNDVRNSNVVTDIIDRDISQIDAVYFTADETNIYLAVVDGSKTKVQVIDKLAQVASDWPGLINYKVAGMTMDANRIYFGDSLINKPAINAYSLKGDYIDGVELAPSVNLGQIYLAGTALYFINKNDNTLHQSSLSWAP